MFAIIGLGNPGPRYTKTRHNAGFRVLEQFVAQNSDSGGNLRWQEKFSCLFSRMSVGGKDCLLIFPQKYMNLSGEASVPLLNYFGVEPADLIVIHDDLDLDPGVLRLKRGGSAAGHRGVGDIIEKLGTDNFMRVRLGIGHPRRAAEQLAAGTDAAPGAGPRWELEKPVADWVLAVPGPEEQAVLSETVLDAAKAVRAIIEQGLESAQQIFNRPRV